MKCFLLFVNILFFLSVHGPAWGTEADELVKRARQVLGVLPQVIVSERNPVTPAKVTLGKTLFYETRISIDGTVSCSKCHPFGLYAADGLRESIGNQCRLNPRNAPTVLNAAAQISAHWIGNRIDVEDQAKQSVIGSPSFGMSSFADVEKKLKAIKGYGPLFEQAFPGEKEPISIDNFAKAIGAFERTLVTPSHLDSFLEGEKEAMNEGEKKGLRTFMEVGCIMCHSGPYLGGQMYQKFGLLEPYWKYTGTKTEAIDEGRFAVTKNESDRYVFKVPVLRNIAKTSPYFHDGSVDSLESAEGIMAKVQLGRNLSKEEIRDIHAFLISLTGKIPDNALQVPLLPSTE